MNKRLILILFAVLFAASALADPVEYPTNKDGSTITGVLTAGFDPLDTAGKGPVYPFPFNLFFLDLETFAISDFTLNLPAEDPTDFGDPLVALSAIDGFSTTEKWTVSFVDHLRNPGSIDPASVVPGQSVRFFHVNTTNLLGVTGIVREMTPGVDYTATLISPSVVAIIPLKPLKEMSSYMAVLTNDIRDVNGNDATADTTYYLTQRAEPWVDENGKSTYPMVPDDLAQTLEVIRPVTNSMEAAAAAAGVVREDIIMAWTAQTQSITPVLKQVRSTAKPAPTVVGPTGMNTAMVGGFGAADIYAGIITIPYYLGIPSAENPLAPLKDFWTAAPGAYVPPFDAMLPDTTSTHVTVANPFPLLTGMQTVPLLMTVPNANSGHQKPAAGWPVVIFGHGLGGNRSQMLAVADTAAAAGYAVIAIDSPLHGITPNDEALAALYIENTVFADIANERTFDVDYVNNVTSAPGPDGIVDDSGTHMINLGSMLTSRDNARQANADLSILAVTIPTISIDGDALPDLDGSTIQYASLSMGSILGTPFVAVEPMVKNAFLSVPMGGIARGLEASSYFGPSIRAGLAAQGVIPGTAQYELFFTVFQTVIDAMDPVNWGAEAALYNNIVLHEVLDDFLLPNYVPTAPLSGTEPLIRAMGLTAYSSTQQDANGLDLVGRFPKPAHHWSFVSPTHPLTGEDTMEIFAEMQKQFASFIASKGKAVAVSDPSVMVPAVQVTVSTTPDFNTGGKSKKSNNQTLEAPSNLMEAVRGAGSIVKPGAGAPIGFRPEPGDDKQIQKPNRFE